MSCINTALEIESERNHNTGRILRKMINWINKKKPEPIVLQDPQVFTISVLKVKDIFVCGHTDCGGMEALLHQEKLQELPAVKAWLQHAETTVRIMNVLYVHLQGEEVFATTIRENVLVQLDHVKRHPAVATGLRRGNLRLHGWVYSIETGEMCVYDSKKKAFFNPRNRKQKVR
jgi:carbonic anhydrase